MLLTCLLGASAGQAEQIKAGEVGNGVCGLGGPTSCLVHLSHLPS